MQHDEMIALSDLKRRLEEIQAKQEEMSAKTDDMHHFFMEPPAQGKPSLSVEIYEAMAAWRASKLMSRFTLWMVGFAAAVTSLLLGFKEIKEWVREIVAK